MIKLLLRPALRRYIMLSGRSSSLCMRLTFGVVMWKYGVPKIVFTLDVTLTFTVFGPVTFLATLEAAPSPARGP